MDATTEAPLKEWETPPTTDTVPPTGVYGYDRVPGTYLRTVTGVQRGEELFHRPELERPWRNKTSQRHAVALALREKEIEELMRKCSSLRTQLGNAKHDAKYVEFAISESAKAQVAELKMEVEQLEMELNKAKQDNEELKTSTQHQLRLMKAQHENELMNLQHENRMLNERCAELTRIYQQQVEDVKKAAARELEYVEVLCNGRVEQLTSELNTLRAQSLAAEERCAGKLTESKQHFYRIEADYKERIRVEEQRVSEVRDRLEAENKKLTEERVAALRDVALATERLTAALADREEILGRFRQWNVYILSLLDGVYSNILESAPELLSEPPCLELNEARSLYIPRLLLEDSLAKVTVERVVYRLLQLKHMGPLGSGSGDGHISTGANKVELLEDLAAKQKRLTRAFQEIKEKCADAHYSFGNILSRLCFFSDNLNDAIAHSGMVPPPQGSVIFVCLGVFKGAHLWAKDVETARTAVSLMNFALRPKMAQYGAYECYSDGVSMLLAFEDPVSACRFCVESQGWLMNLPWPSSLLQDAWGKEERDKNNNVVFRGLRVCMAVHTGEAFVEPTAIPCGDSYRCHYYGRAVSQVMYLCSIAQGGQVLVTEPVWNRCVERTHELGAFHVWQLGMFPIFFFNKELKTCESESFLIRHILPHNLSGRSFQELLAVDDKEIANNTPLTAMKRSVVLDEITCVGLRRASLKEAVNVVNEELLAVDRLISVLRQRMCEEKAYFHLLPPPEMVTQMNNLYAVLEKIAARASELRDNISDINAKQEEIALQAQGLKEYCHQYVSLETRAEELQACVEMTHLYYDERIAEMRQSHADNVEQLQRRLHEREQLVQRLYSELQTAQKSQ